MKHLIPKSYLEKSLHHPSRNVEKTIKNILKGGINKESIAEMQKLVGINLSNYKFENGKLTHTNPDKADKFNAIMKKLEERKVAR